MGSSRGCVEGLAGGFMCRLCACRLRDAVVVALMDIGFRWLGVC